VKNSRKKIIACHTAKMKAPSFLMVLTGVGKFANKRTEDNVIVVPIGCLKNETNLALWEITSFQSIRYRPASCVS
jgi:2'-5' RNA ligase